MVASLKPKIAEIVRQQIPAVFNDRYDKFIQFIEKYYEWMESSGNPLDFIRYVIENHDYDLADEKYKKLLESGVLQNLPKLNVDKNILIKNIKEIYRRKGSEDALQFFIRALFSENSKIKYGKDYYLTSSDSTTTNDVIICLKKPTVSCQALLTKGAISEVRVLESSYYFDEPPTITAVRTQRAAIEFPEIELVMSGFIKSISITNGGYGYEDGVIITVNGTCNIPAVITPIVTGGVLTGVTLTNPGAGYREKPTITVTGINGKGFGASVSCEWEGQIAAVNIIDGKSGWEEPPVLDLIGGQETIEIRNDANEIIEIRRPTPTKISFDVNTSGVVTNARIVSVGSPYFIKPELRWYATAPKDAILSPILQNKKLVAVKVIDGGTLYQTPPLISISVDNTELFKFEGNIIEQVGDSYAKAIVDNVSKQTINGFDYYICKLQKKGLYGTFLPNEYVKCRVDGKDIYGLVAPIFSDVNILNQGSCYKKGQRISFIDEGAGGNLMIEEVSRGSVDEVLITKHGQGYQVGDKIVPSGSFIGSDFEGEVTHIDGYGAKVRFAMELDEIRFLDRGYNYQVGDIVYVYGGNLPISSIKDAKLAKLKVTSVVDSDNLKSLKIESGGYGYSYISLAILPTSGSTSPIRQIRPNFDSYVNGVKESSKGILTSKIVSGQIQSLDWKLTNPDLDNSSVQVIVNGNYGKLAINSVNSSGGITKLTIEHKGINYVEPVLKFVSTTGSKAIINLIFDEYGSMIPDNDIQTISWSSNYVTVITQNPHKYKTGQTITISGCSNTAYNGIKTIEVINDNSFKFYSTNNLGGAGGIVHCWTIVNPGIGFTIDDNIEIVERTGFGAIVQPIFEKGGIGSFEFLDRGEFYEIDKYGSRKYSYYGGSGTGLELDLYYRPKKFDILDEGQFYSNYTFTISEGHGSGAIIDMEVVNDTITGISINSPGSGYTWCRIIIQSETGSGFVAKPTISSGQIVAVEIVDGGKNYDALDTVLVYGDGTGASFSISQLKDGVVRNVRVLNSGSHYHYGCVLKITSLNAPSDEAELQPIIENGKLKDVKILSRGAGYSLDSTIELIYEESSKDPDSSHVFKGIGKYTGDYYDPLEGTEVVKYGSNGTEIGNNSPIWPLSGAGLVNTMFQVVDFVDIWPQTVAYPKQAKYKIDSEPYGAITSIKVEKGGYGYYDETEILPLELRVNGDGYGAKLHAVIKNGSIVDVIIEEGGDGYTTAAINVIGGLLPGLGSAAQLEPYIVNGKIEDVAIINPGVGYYYGTTVDIDGDGVGAKAIAIVETGITRVEVIETSSDHISAPLLVITDNNPPGTLPGTGAELLPIIENGKIKEVKIINPGQGYHNPQLNIIGGGSVAILSAYADRYIKEIKVVSSGRNYTNVSVKIIGDGEGAKATANISKSSLKNIDLYYKGNRYSRYPEITVTDNSNFGAISKVKINKKGSDFTELPTLTVKSNNGILGEIVSFSDSIGRIKSVRFEEFAFGNENDYKPLLQFPIVCLVPENVSFVDGEYVYVKNYNPNDLAYIPHAKVKTTIFDKNLLILEEATDSFEFVTESGVKIVSETNNPISHEMSAKIQVGDILVGTQSESEGKILKMNRAYGESLMQGFGEYPLSIKYSNSILSNSNIKATNNSKYHDFSYIVETGLQLSDYKDFIKTLTHMAGYSISGDVIDETFVESKIKLPFDEKVGKSVLDILILYLYVEAVSQKRKYNEVWRIENRRNELINSTIPELELELENGINEYVTYPSAVSLVREVGSGIYSLIGNTITITKNDHGLVEGDLVFLDFTSGDAISDTFTVKTASTNSFTVETWKLRTGNVEVTSGSITVTGTYEWSPNQLLITIENHGFSANDEVYVKLKTGYYLAGNMIIDSVSTNTFTIILPMARRTTSTSSSGTVIITHYKEKQWSTVSYSGWRSNYWYGTNSIVEIDNREYISKIDHLSSGINNRYGSNDKWFPFDLATLINYF